MLLFYSCRENNGFLGQKVVQSDHFIPKSLAKKIAKNFIYSKIIKNKSLKKGVKSVFPVPDEDDNIIFYIVNYEEGGFIILSADDRLMPILAHSDENSFPIKKMKYPRGLVGWLSNVKNSIKSIRKSNIGQTSEVKKEWKRILIPRENNYFSSNYEQIGPLLHLKWHQGGGFNDLLDYKHCEFEGGRVLVGCVPLAIAMIMKYWEYPNYYDWANIPDTLDTEDTAARRATSSLIFDITFYIFPHIHYGCDATSVDNSFDESKLFRSDFHYSSARKGHYNFGEIKRNIYSRHPVILSGYEGDFLGLFPTGDGHEWVCDGFEHVDDDFEMLYMHWGWNGDCNGWFFDKFFVPETGDDFSHWLRMIYDIIP